jgi:hypothetical protein
MPDDISTTNASETTKAGGVAAAKPPDGSQGRPRSGLTGHILPSFWRMAPPSAKTIGIGAPVPPADPATTGTSTPATQASASARHWWQVRLAYSGSIRRATTLVIVCALLSLGIYLYGTLRFPLAAHLMPPPLDIGKLTSSTQGQYSAVAGELFLIAIGLLFGAWGLVYWVAGHIERQTRTGWWRTPLLLSVPLFCFPAAALLVLLFMYPITAVDVFGYASQIRVWTIYHANPLTTPPSAFPGDPFLPFNSWPGQPSPYAPLWILLSALVSHLAGDSFFSAVIFQKLLSLVACLGCMGFIWLLAKRLCPERRWQAFVFFAWNPLVLFETGANGHNDAVMVVFMLAGLWALLSTRWYVQTLALPLLVASVLVKWISVLLLPLAVIYLLRGGRARRWGLAPLGLGAALTVAYAVPLVAPFWDTRYAPGVLLQAQYFTASPPALLHQLLEPIYSGPIADTVVRLIGLGAFGLVYLFILARLAFPGVRERVGPDASFTPDQRLLIASLESYFWYLVLAAFWFQAWYLVALLPLAALDPRPLARTRSALFSLGASLSYVVFVFIWVIYWQGLPLFTVQLIACLIIYGLALFTRMLEGWQTRLHFYVLLVCAQFPPVLADAGKPRRRKSWWLL